MFFKSESGVYDEKREIIEEIFGYRGCLECYAWRCEVEQKSWRDTGVVESGFKYGLEFKFDAHSHS